MAPKQTCAARGRPVEPGPVVGAGCPEPSPRPPAPMVLGLIPSRTPVPPCPPRGPPPMATRPPAPAAAVDRSPAPDCAAVSAGRATGPGPDAARCEREQRHHHGDEGGGQQRRPRVQPKDRRDEPEGPPHAIKKKRDGKLRQRKLGAAAPAGLLPETADHRPSLPAGETRQQVDRDPPRETFGNALQTGHVVRSGHEVPTTNADHGSDHSRRSIHTRTPKKHTGSPRRRISSTEYNATVCHVHGK